MRPDDQLDDGDQRVADLIGELLPLIEPPPGWEDRAVARWKRERRRERRRRLVLVAVLVVGVFVLLLALHKARL